MSRKTQKAFEVAFFLLIIVASITIFLFRNRIQNVSNISYLGLIVLCFLANSTVMLPSPSLMIAASCALIMNPLLVAICAALGSTLGEFVGYAFGSVSKDLSPRFKKIIDVLSNKIHSPSLLVFIFAVLPLPLFDIVGVYSGGTRMKLTRFFPACFAGKFIKLLLYTKIYDVIDWITAYMPGFGGLQ